jgi:hypothetical protein
MKLKGGERREGAVGAVGAALSLEKSQILGEKLRERDNFALNQKQKSHSTNIHSFLSDAIKPLSPLALSVYTSFRELSRETLHCVPKVRQHKGAFGHRRITCLIWDQRDRSSTYRPPAAKTSNSHPTPTKHQSLSPPPSITTSNQTPVLIDASRLVARLLSQHCR